jgi:hypothetical protein
MSERTFRLVAAAMLLAGRSESASSSSDASGWQHPQMAWGDPDLQGGGRGPEVLTQPWKARYPMQRDDT